MVENSITRSLPQLHALALDLLADCDVAERGEFGIGAGADLVRAGFAALLLGAADAFKLWLSQTRTAALATHPVSDRRAAEAEELGRQARGAHLILAGLPALVFGAVGAFHRGAVPAFRCRDVRKGRLAERFLLR